MTTDRPYETSSSLSRLLRARAGGHVMAVDPLNAVGVLVRLQELFDPIADVAGEASECRSRVVDLAALAGVQLDARGAWQARLLVRNERALWIAAILREQVGEHIAVLDRLRGALCEIRQHRVSRVTQERHAPLCPARQRIAIIERPFVATLRTREEL